MTDLTTRIAVLEAAEAKATEGLWEVERIRGHAFSQLFVRTDKDIELIAEGDDDDMELLAALRNDALAIIREQQAEIARLREALQSSVDALVKHHQWHAAQTDPDPEHGFIPADEYDDSALYDVTVAALSQANWALTNGQVNNAALGDRA